MKIDLRIFLQELNIQVIFDFWNIFDERIITNISKTVLKRLVHLKIFLISVMLVCMFVSITLVIFQYPQKRPVTRKFIVSQRIFYYTHFLVFTAGECIQSTSKRQRKTGGKLLVCMYMSDNTESTNAPSNVTLNARVDFHCSTHPIM